MDTKSTHQELVEENTSLKEENSSLKIELEKLKLAYSQLKQHATNLTEQKFDTLDSFENVLKTESQPKQPNTQRRLQVFEDIVGSNTHFQDGSKKEEMRIAPNGYLYTKSEFQQYFKSLHQWNNAKTPEELYNPDGYRLWIEDTTPDTNAVVNNNQQTIPKLKRTKNFIDHSTRRQYQPPSAEAEPFVPSPPSPAP